MKLLGFEIRKTEPQKEETRSLDINEIFSSGGLLFGSNTYNGSSQSLSAVYRCTELISDSIAMLPIKVKILDKKHKEDFPEHPVNLLFNSNRLTKYNLIKLLLQSVMLKGAGFAYIERASSGIPVNIRFLKHGDVTINYNEKTEELSYSCSKISAKRIEPCNMIHLIKNSYDGVNGVSIIQSAINTINLAKSTETSAREYFQNGCNLSGIVTTEAPMSNKQVQDLKNNWNTVYSSGNKGLAVLHSGLKYQAIQSTSQDAQLLQTREFNVQDLARFFGIHPSLLGIGSTTNLEQAQQEFLVHTLQPYIIMIEEEFTRKLFLPSESNLEINLDESYMLRSDKTAQATYYSTLLDKGVLCINEVRKELGYSEIEGGDKHIIPYTDINMNDVTNTNEEEQ